MKDGERRRRQLTQQKSYLQSLRQWFVSLTGLGRLTPLRFTENRWAKAHSILSNNDEDAISLRVLEYLSDAEFVAECEAAGVPLRYYVESADGTQRRLFNLPAELLATQSMRRKKFMEAFARQNADLDNGGRFQFGYDTIGKVDTNVAQLQFMKFMIENHVLEWVRKHKETIFRIKSECEQRRRKRRKQEQPGGVGGSASNSVVINSFSA